MRLFSHRVFRAVWIFAAASCLLAQTSGGSWDTAVQAREDFESQPAGTHTRMEYARVMDGFRAIYHESSNDIHASRAVQQVAELLAEQGHELNDARSLSNAAGQYDFLQKAYPYSAAAKESRTQAAELRAEMSQPVATPSVATPVQQEEPKKAADAYDPATADHYIPASKRKPASAFEAEAPNTESPVVNDAAAVTESVPKKIAMVTGIRHWSTRTYTRVAIDLGDQVQYEAARVENPDRIYFDLHHSRLAQQLSGKSFAITDDGFLTRIRAAQFSNDITRVVLDVHEVSEYSAFLLPNPYRLIIDIHGKSAGNQEQGIENSDLAPDEAPPSPKKPDAPVSKPAQTEVSSLPPMEVTDGSAGFGLPSKKSGSAKSEVAQPRVVVSSRPTLSKPVPNTVTSRSNETPKEVAAVSLQSGRVEATPRPTSQPISSRSSRSPHVEGAPVEAAPPTSDGETSLLRALGLKIGRIVIDAGHGGHDSGTLGVGGIEEKDVVLDVALRLGKLLHDKLGSEIVYTRADDTFIPLETRTAIANKAQADLFISVHANSSADETARGVEVYYLNFTSDPDAMRVAGRENAVSTQSVHELSDLVKKIALKDKIDESRELAEDVDKSLFAGLTKGNVGLKNRGVKKAPFVVLIGANMPSILAEISFVTNPDDAAELRTPEYRQRVAQSLFEGVQRYASSINGKKPAVKTTESSVR